MKNYFLFFFLCLSIALNAQAQDAERRFYLAPVVGFNMAQLDGDDLAGYNQIGLNAGLRLYSRINDRWRWSMEFAYSQQGSDRSANDALSAAFDNIRLNFVDVPFLIHYQDWKFEVGTGVSYSNLINFKTVDFTGEDVTDLQDYNTSVLTWIADVTFFFQENLGLNVKWAKNFTSIKADEGAGRLIGKYITVRGIYVF